MGSKNSKNSTPTSFNIQIKTGDPNSFTSEHDTAENLVKAVDDEIRNFSENHDLKEVALAYKTRGDFFFKVFGIYEKAIEYYTNCLLILPEDKTSAIAQVNSILGDAYFQLKEFRNSVSCYEKSLKYSKKVKDSYLIAQESDKIGEAYICLKEYKNAISYLYLSLEANRAINDHSAQARIYSKLMNIYVFREEYQEVIKCSQKAFESLKKKNHPDDSEIAAAINSNLGVAYRRVGKFEEAIECHKKGLKYHEEIRDRENMAVGNTNLANVYNDLGKYDNAIEHHKKSLENYKAVDDRLGIANVHQNLGIVYQYLADYERATDCFLTALENYEITDHLGRANANGHLGSVYLNLKKHKIAIEYFEEALKINTEIRNQSVTSFINGNLGIAYQELREYEKAINCFQISLDTSVELGNENWIASTFGNFGLTLLDLRCFEYAIAFLEKGLEISTSIGTDLGKITKNANLGLAYQGLRQHEKATLHMIKSIRFFDEMFLNSVPDDNKLLFAVEHFKLHLCLMSSFIALWRIESALLVVDIGKAKELHCWIEKHKPVVKFLHANRIWERIDCSEERLETEQLFNFCQVESNNTSILFFAFDANQFLYTWVLSNNVSCRVIISDLRLETFSELIIPFLKRRGVTLKRGFSFFNYDSDAEKSSRAIATSLETSEARAPGKNVDHSDPAFDDTETLRRLYQLLVEPAMDIINGNKLIIVPDKELFFVPFCSLVDEKNCPLSRSYSIQITPSLHTLRSSIERSDHPDLGYALFVGNPTVGRVSLHGKEYFFQDLSGADKEVQYLSKRFETKPLSGRSATKKEVMKLLGGASIVHIAAHGEENRGEILLSTNPLLDQSDRTEESFLLTQQDIMNIPLKARLVVLCCCYSGQGKVSSEGVIGITRTFLAAGARSVLATLWPINDMASQEFMRMFYDEIFKETLVCEALRKTMNFFQNYKKTTVGEASRTSTEKLTEKIYQSVSTWAPFTIYGEDVRFRKDEMEKVKVQSRKMQVPTS